MKDICVYKVSLYSKILKQEESDVEKIKYTVCVLLIIQKLWVDMKDLITAHNEKKIVSALKVLKYLSIVTII